MTTTGSLNGPINNQRYRPQTIFHWFPSNKKVCGHPTVNACFRTERLIQNLWTFICCYNSLHSLRFLTPWVLRHQTGFDSFLRGLGYGGALSRWNRKGPSVMCWCKAGSSLLRKISLYVVASTQNFLKSSKFECLVLLTVWEKKQMLTVTADNQLKIIK